MNKVFKSCICFIVNGRSNIDVYCVSFRVFIDMCGVYIGIRVFVFKVLEYIIGSIDWERKVIKKYFCWLVI